MWVKNFTDKDLTLEKKGLEIILTANTSTLIPDNVVTEEDLFILFGKGNVAVDEDGEDTSIELNQQEVETGKLYQTFPLTITPDIRIYVDVASTVSVYGSDSDEIPTSFSSMDCPEENQDVTGCLSTACIPKLLAFQGSANKIIITNCKLVEVGDLS